MLILDIICLIIWTFWFFYGAYCGIQGDKRPDTFTFCCAALTCVTLFLEKIVS